jgi:hypothetical protein
MVAERLAEGQAARPVPRDAEAVEFEPTMGVTPSRSSRLIVRLTIPA